MIPAPPQGYGTLRPAVRTVMPGTILYRINHGAFSSSLHFGSTGQSRWDDPERRYGVLYVADSVEGAFAETYGHGINQIPLEQRVLSEASLASRRLFAIHITAPVEMIEFHGSGLPRLGLDGQITTVPDYAKPQAWSRWVFDSPERFAGLCYHSRHLPTSMALAFFDRARLSLEEDDLGPLAEWSGVDGADIYEIMDSQGWGLI